MGISGLLPLLQKIQKPTHIENYKGQTIAIDGHCILHRGSYGDATSLALNQEATSYINYFINFIKMFEFHNVTPIVVFDGLPLPIKGVTNDERSKNRQKALHEGLILYEKGNREEAAKYFRQSIKITPDMIRNVIMELKKKRVEVIVAPYEADVQLTYLMKTKKVSAVVTEDSDLLAFGCAKLIYKMDRYGSGTEINYNDVFTVPELLCLDSPEKLRHMCIISGCDYLPSVKGIGIKTSLRYFKELGSLQRVLNRLQFRHHMPKEYKEAFERANYAFLHQWVYDIDQKQYVRFTPLPTLDNDYDFSFLGKFPSIQESTLLRVNKIIYSRESQQVPPIMQPIVKPSKPTKSPLIARYLKDKNNMKVKSPLRYNSFSPYIRKLDRNVRIDIKLNEDPIINVKMPPITYQDQYDKENVPPFNNYRAYSSIQKNTLKDTLL